MLESTVPAPSARVQPAALLRYAGEVQIARMDLPADPDIGRLGRIVDEDLALLETFRNRANFRLIRAEEK